MDITLILTREYAGSEWVLDGDTYAGLTWLSDTTKPTEAELTALWPTVQTAIADEAQAKLDRKASVITKLEALGLTTDEVADAFGLEAL